MLDRNAKLKEGVEIAKADGWPILGALPNLLRDVIGTFRKTRERYGDLVEFRLPNETAYLVSDPDLVKEVFIAGEPQFTKGRYTQRMSAVFGGGLVTAEGDHWKRQRKLLQPFFTNAAIRNWQPIVCTSVKDMIVGWRTHAEAGAPVDAVVASRSLLQRMMGDIMFGREISADEAFAAAKAVSTMNDALIEEFFRTTLLGRLSRFAPTPSALRFRRAVKTFDEIVDRAIGRETAPDGEHLIAQFRQARYADDGKPMTAKQFRDEVATFFFAGQETTANALAWAFYFLARHQHVADRLAEEARAVLGDSDPEFDDLAKLHYTKQVVHETLRLRPPAYAVERRTAKAGAELSGCPMKGDALVVLAPSVTHAHPAHWEEPDRFNPDRFATDAVRSRHPYAFFPFGGGARKCIGMGLSIMELTTALAMTARDFSFALGGRVNVKAKTGLTLQPSPGVPIKLTLRRSG